MNKKNLFLAVKILLAVAFLYYLIRQGKLDISQVGHAISLDNWTWLALAATCMCTAMCVSVERWRTLLRSQNIVLPFFKALKISFIGFFFNLFMPGSVGGDFIKAYYIARKQEERRTEAVFSVFFDRIIGLISLILVATISVLFQFDFFWNSEFKPLVIFLMSFSGAFVLASLLFVLNVLHIPKFVKKYMESPSETFFHDTLVRLYQAMLAYREKPHYLSYTIFLSFVSHSLQVAVCFCVAQTLGDSTFGILTFFVLVPLGMVIQAIPLTFGGWGLGEAAFQYIFEQAAQGVGSPQGANICFMWRLLNSIWSLVGIVFYIEEKAEVDRLIQVEQGNSQTSQ